MVGGRGVGVLRGDSTCRRLDGRNTDGHVGYSTRDDRARVNPAGW